MNQARIVGPNDSSIAGVLVPAGTVISTSSTYVHLDPTVLPNPHHFNPDRWLGIQGKKLDPHLISFSRGPRSCLGINLAWSELYMIFGTVFKQVRFSIHNTAEDDLKEFNDFFVPVPRKQEFLVTVAQRWTHHQNPILFLFQNLYTSTCRYLFPSPQTMLVGRKFL